MLSGPSLLWSFALCSGCLGLWRLGWLFVTADTKSLSFFLSIAPNNWALPIFSWNSRKKNPFHLSDRWAVWRVTFLKPSVLVCSSARNLPVFLTKVCLSLCSCSLLPQPPKCPNRRIYSAQVQYRVKRQPALMAVALKHPDC